MNNNETKLINYLGYLIKTLHLDGNDTYNRDINVFTNYFSSEDFEINKINTNSQEITQFTLKDLNKTTIEFQKLTYQDMFYSYSIKIFSKLIPNNSIDVIEELNIAKNLKNKSMIEKIIEQYENEVNYTASIEKYGEQKFDLNLNEYLRFHGDYFKSHDIYKYRSEIYFGQRDENTQKFSEQLITTDKAVEIYSSHYNFSSRLLNFIHEIYSFDMKKNIDSFLNESLNQKISGEDMLKLLVEVNIKNYDVAKKSIYDMLDKEGFLIETTQNLELYLCNENREEAKIIPIIETVRQKIIETGYPNGEDILNDIIWYPTGEFYNGCIQYQIERNNSILGNQQIQDFLRNGLPIKESLIRDVTNDKLSVTKKLEDIYNDFIKNVDKVENLKKEYGPKSLEYIQSITYQFVSAYKITQDICIIYNAIVNELNRIMNNDMFINEMKTIDNNKYKKMVELLDEYNRLPNNTTNFILGKKILINSCDFFKVLKKIRTTYTTQHYEEKTNELNQSIIDNKTKIQNLENSIGIFTFGKRKQSIESQITELKNQIMTSENTLNKLNEVKKDLFRINRSYENRELIKTFNFDDYVETVHPVYCYLEKEEINNFLKTTEKYLSKVFMELPISIIKGTPYTSMDYRLDIVLNDETNNYELKLFNKLTDSYENIEINHNISKIYNSFNSEVFKELDIIGPALDKIYNNESKSKNQFYKCVDFSKDDR